MNDLDELIRAADSLCATLEKAAANEKMFCHNVQLVFERYSWEVYKMKNDIAELKQYIGV